MRSRPGRVHFLGFVDDACSRLYASAALRDPIQNGGLRPTAIGALLPTAHPWPPAAPAPFPKSLGPAAVYFNPNDIEDLYRAMEQLFKDKAARARVLAAAPAVLARYCGPTTPAPLIRPLSDCRQATHMPKQTSSGSPCLNPIAHTYLEHPSVSKNGRLRLWTQGAYSTRPSVTRSRTLRRRMSFDWRLRAHQL